MNTSTTVATNGTPYQIWGKEYAETDHSLRACYSCIAAFRYFQEALDFVAYAQQRGATVVMRDFSLYPNKPRVAVYAASASR